MENIASRKIVQVDENGLLCPLGGFYIDPWRPVERAIITHAHADHACRGCTFYLTSREGEAILRQRMDDEASIHSVEYGETLVLGGVRVSLYPAGHVLGSAQVRLEHRGQVWVVSGDYKLDADPTCTPFEAVRCHGFVSEATFGLPVYRWPPPREVFREIDAWWRANRSAGKASILLGYSLGKAQRLLAGLDTSIGPVYAHGAVEKLNQVYRAAGIALPPVREVREAPARNPWREALILAPPAAAGTAWMRRFGEFATGLASGWMRIRGVRRRRAVDRGFVLSDHADWPALLRAIRETGAETVWVTHGAASPLVRYLRESGLDAHAVPTAYSGEQEDAPSGEPAA